MKNDGMPGPGQYKIPEMIVEGPAYSIRMKPAGKTEDKSPGPGQYTIKNESKAPAPVFGTSKRTDKNNSEGPGPAKYYSPMKDLKGWMIKQP